MSTRITWVLTPQMYIWFPCRAPGADNHDIIVDRVGAIRIIKKELWFGPDPVQHAQDVILPVEVYSLTQCVIGTGHELYFRVLGLHVL